MRNEEKLNKRVALISSIISILLVAAVGFAYFSATVVNTNNEKLSTETATLSLKFEDGDSGISGNLNLGESITKKFTLANTGTLDAYAKINWYNLVNTYMTGSLTYNLEQSTSENGTYKAIDSSNVPVSSTETTETLKNGILVPVNTTYYYKLTITFNNLDNVNQNSDINANFYSYFSLEEGSLSGADKIKNLVAGANTSSTDVITKETPQGATCTNTLAYDGTSDNNLRYVGKNPCNYVSFNNETWRIIGVMNNVDDGTGVTETRIKLIRATSLGNYSWDTSDSSVNSGSGVNDWTQADLKNELNGDYLNTSLNANTNWYNGSNNTQTATFDYTKRLSAGAGELIGDAKWYLGGHYTEADRVPSTMYTKERGTTVWGSTSGQTCNDGACPRALFWTGKVALIYPSDYGYATSGGTTTTRSDCIGTVTTYSWDSSSYSDCKNNDWLKPSSGYNWLLSPYSYLANGAFYVTYTGDVDSTGTYGNYRAVLPAVYLQSGVTISGGNGTLEKPYVLG